MDELLGQIGSSRAAVFFATGGALIAIALAPGISRHHAVVALVLNLAVAVFATPGLLDLFGIKSTPAALLLHALVGLTGLSLVRGLSAIGRAFENDPIGTLQRLRNIFHGRTGNDD
jgi:hypothetical protein